MSLKLNVVMLSVANKLAEFLYAECRYAECRYAECRGALQCILINEDHCDTKMC